MHQSETYSHRHAEEILKDKGMLDQILSLVQQPSFAVTKGNTRKIKTELNKSLVGDGWAIKPRVHGDYNLTVNAVRAKVGLTVQTGYITRAFYDLMKFEVMYRNDRIDTAVLILPTSAAASIFGKNVSNFSRVSSELALFRHVITVPCLLVSFE